VIVSYLEWRQNLDNEHWDEPKVNTELERYLVAATQVIWEEHVKQQVPLEEAAMRVALKRLINEE
jgi:glutamate dehydrogenase/leucine dehydrogenase